MAAQFGCSTPDELRAYILGKAAQQAATEAQLEETQQRNSFLDSVLALLTQHGCNCASLADISAWLADKQAQVSSLNSIMALLADFNVPSNLPGLPVEQMVSAILYELQDLQGLLASFGCDSINLNGIQDWLVRASAEATHADRIFELLNQHQCPTDDLTQARYWLEAATLDYTLYQTKLMYTLTWKEMLMDRRQAGVTIAILEKHLKHTMRELEVANTERDNMQGQLTQQVNTLMADKADLQGQLTARAADLANTTTQYELKSEEVERLHLLLEPTAIMEHVEANSMLQEEITALQDVNISLEAQLADTTKALADVTADRNRIRSELVQMLLEAD